MTENPVTPARDEDALLAQMLEMAEQLAATDDALLAGQYDYLRARIAALMEIRSGAGLS
ncbi:hypothetical protein [Croceicoccus estronivorus]|uniref:hypothetical protein n=1 Tax=Croceicoccus estronivorus TaxID=1172626 RepID=UPI000A622ECA|nr:hypothetical protein [Croceicoccus estronivorus]